MNKIIEKFLGDKKTYKREEVESLLEELGLISSEERSICDCYRTMKDRHYYTDYEKGVYFGVHGIHLKEDYTDIDVGYCAGTKECDRCSCGGDVKKCDFYSYKRGEK